MKRSVICDTAASKAPRSSFLDAETAVLSRSMTANPLDSELRTSEEKYQRLFESLSDGAALLEVVLDPAGTPVDYLFLDVNPAYEQVIGIERASRIGRRLSEFSGPDNPCFGLLGRVAQSGEPGRTEMYFENLKRYFRVSAFPSNRGTVTALVSDVTERKRAEDNLQAAEECLVTELAAMTRLHAIATRFVREGDLPALLEEVVEAAVSVVGADMASIQLRDPLSGELKLTAQHGFGPAFVDHFAVDHFACGRPDAESSDREAMRAAGVLAIQTTPLGSRSGKIVGLLSTYLRRAHQLPSHSLKLLELLALQCADAIERARWAEEAATLNARAAYAQKLRESEERFRTTVENIPLNLVLYDREFRLLYLNPALSLQCSVKLKIPKEELVGKFGEELWPEAVWAPLRKHGERAIQTGERQTYELANDLPGRPPFVRQWTIVPLSGSDGQVDQLLVMSEDITAQRHLLDELREADRRKSEFIAVLSHELRNPLAAIRTTLYVLEHGAPGSQAVVNAREVIDRQVGHVVRMVDDLLDVTRISRNKIELQRRPLDLRQVVRETIQDNRSHLELGGVRLEVRVPETPVMVSADGARISQVITNLLSNAIKFSPTGGAVTVSVTADPASARAVLRVSDTGAGIDSQLIERLFEPFMQGDNTLDRNSGGLGLGLALVKGLVALHGGEVSVKSAGRGQGAEFTVRLPLQAGLVAEAKPAPAQSPPQSGRRVLIVDDDRDVADGLRAALEIHTHQVAVAGNGPDALAAARLFKPDVVFCDIGLPGMNGYEVARAFRADEAFRSTLLVALSGYAQAEDLAKASAAGFDQHLAKPPNIERIKRICVGANAIGSAGPASKGDPVPSTS
jgi:PAS domain S-box-containing protein